MSEATTPRPWKISEHFSDDDTVFIVAQDDAKIAEVQPRHLNYSARATAALIVTAVNAHDRYESALRMVKTWLISPDLSPDTLAQIRETVNGALGERNLI